MSKELSIPAALPIEAAKSLDNFASYLNCEPSRTALEKDPKGFDYIPVSFIQIDLDEAFLGLWSWEVRNVQVVANEILVYGDLKFFHPIAQTWLTRSGVGAAMIRQVKGAAITDIGANIKDAISMDLPHAETDAFKIAAKKIGKRFGRDLNRKFVDQYQQQVETPEEAAAREIAGKVEKLTREVVRTLSECENATEKARVTALLKEHRANGTLGLPELKSALEALKIACK